MVILLRGDYATAMDWVMLRSLLTQFQDLEQTITSGQLEGNSISALRKAITLCRIEKRRTAILKEMAVLRGTRENYEFTFPIKDIRYWDITLYSVPSKYIDSVLWTTTETEWFAALTIASNR